MAPLLPTALLGPCRPPRHCRLPPTAPFSLPLRSSTNEDGFRHPTCHERLLHELVELELEALRFSWLCTRLARRLLISCRGSAPASGQGKAVGLDIDTLP